MRKERKKNILSMTSAMTSAARHELHVCEMFETDVIWQDFVDRARDFLTVLSTRMNSKFLYHYKPTEVLRREHSA